jgi:hypothetical protein
MQAVAILFLRAFSCEKPSNYKERWPRLADSSEFQLDPQSCIEKACANPPAKLLFDPIRKNGEPIRNVFRHNQRINGSLFSVHHDRNTDTYTTKLTNLWDQTDFEVFLNGQPLPKEEHIQLADNLERRLCGTEQGPYQTISLQVEAWNEAKNEFESIHHQDVLPLRVDSKIRVKLQSATPRYVNLFWIDGQGKLIPLYPWKPGEWNQLPNNSPALSIELPEPTPEKPNPTWPLEGQGVETVFAFTSDKPLSSEQIKKLQKRFKGIKVPERTPSSKVAYPIVPSDSAPSGSSTRSLKLNTADIVNVAPNHHGLVERFHAELGACVKGLGTVLRGFSFYNAGNE